MSYANRLILGLTMVTLVGCSAKSPEFRRIDDLPSVLTSEPSVVFSIGASGAADRIVPEFKGTPLEGARLDSLKLYRYDSNNNALIAEPFKVAGNAMVGDFIGGERYLLHGPFDPIIDVRHNLLCRMVSLDFNRLVDNPRIVDPLCTRILCPSQPYRADELLREFPFLNNAPETFPPDELRDLTVRPPGEANPRTQPRAAAASSVSAFGDLCEQCIGRNWPDRIVIPDCTPPPRLARLEGSIINIIPNGLSGETNQDSEPNVTVNPANPDEIVASAFTPNPAGVGNAPIFFSTDAGTTWQINATVQSQISTGDITVRFTETTGNLYAGILRRPGGLRMSIQSTADFAAATPMNVEVDRPPNASGLGPDQPYVMATDVGGQDRVYVGNNDLLVTPQTASIEQTLDDAATWTTQRLESRTTLGQDLPPVRPAIGPDNVIYSAYIARRTTGAEVVVVRDDSGATGATTFADLTGSDGNAGVRVVTGITVPFENFSHPNLGQERLVSSDLSIAVDPNDAARVCVAWGDRVNTEVITTHLRCSTDSGQNWDDSDQETLTNTKNPALAFNSRGQLGFLFQSVRTTGGTDRWVTTMNVYDTGFSRITGAVLATTPANTPAFTFLPYIGDYVHLLTIGEEFHGIFSANNTPRRGNFPLGVTYQREADFTSQTLMDLSGDPVATSIDPFYFSLHLEN